MLYLGKEKGREKNKEALGVAGGWGAGLNENGIQHLMRWKVSKLAEGGHSRFEEAVDVGIRGGEK